MEQSKSDSSIDEKTSGLENAKSIKADLKQKADELRNRRYSIMGIESDKLDTPIINYCYEVDDEIEIANAND